MCLQSFQMDWATWVCGERVISNAMVHEMRKEGLVVEAEKPIQVIYDGVIVGNYVADLVVEGLVLVELKCVRAFDDGHTAQCLNYLAATGLAICLLINFAKKWK